MSVAFICLPLTTWIRGKASVRVFTDIDGGYQEVCEHLAAGGVTVIQS